MVRRHRRPGNPLAYAYARKNGLLVAGVGGGDGPEGWITYISVHSVDRTVADADAAFARALALGAQVVTPLFDTMYTRMGSVEDPQGGVLTLSEYRPPA